MLAWVLKVKNTILYWILLSSICTSVFTKTVHSLSPWIDWDILVKMMANEHHHQVRLRKGPNCFCVFSIYIL